MSGIFDNLIKRIIDKLIEDGTIDASEADDYRFGLEVTLLKAGHYLSYLLIAFCMRKLPEFIIIFAVLCAFRRNTGGFHARTRLGCYFFSCTVILVSLLLSEVEINIFPMCVLLLFGLTMLHLLTPVQNKHRRLDDEENRCFRHRLFWLSVVLLIACAIMAVFGSYRLFWFLTVGVSLDAFLTILGKIQYETD